MTIRKGDNVVVRSGQDRGKRGKVLRVFPDKRQVLVEGANEVKKRRRPRRANEKGQTVSISMPINVSNVALWCLVCNTGRRTRVRLEGGKKIRVCVKCKETL